LRIGGSGHGRALTRWLSGPARAGFPMAGLRGPRSQVSFLNNILSAEASPSVVMFGLCHGLLIGNLGPRLPHPVQFSHMRTCRHLLLRQQSPVFAEYFPVNNRHRSPQRFKGHHLPLLRFLSADIFVMVNSFACRKNATDLLYFSRILCVLLHGGIRGRKVEFICHPV
jgi:hypothetical protein